MTVTSGAAHYLANGLPAPAMSPRALDAPYWQGARGHELKVQVCAGCGRAQWPPEEICAGCHSFDRTWVTAAGTGEVYAWTRVWHPVHPALKEQGPYIVVVVLLADHGVRMVGNLIGDPMQPVTVGMPVQVVFEDHEEGYTLVHWRRPD